MKVTVCLSLPLPLLVSAAASTSASSSASVSVSASASGLDYSIPLPLLLSTLSLYSPLVPSTHPLSPSLTSFHHHSRLGPTPYSTCPELPLNDSRSLQIITRCPIRRLKQPCVYHSVARVMSLAAERTQLYREPFLLWKAL